MKKVASIIIPVFALLMCLSFPSPLFAATTTSSAAIAPLAQANTAASDSGSADTTEKLKERIDKVIEQQKDRVKGVMDSLGLKKRGQVGEVQRVTETSITVKNAKATQIMAITPEVVIIRDNKKATIDDIAVGDWVLALGYQKGEEFQLRRLQVTSTSPFPVLPTVLIGTLRSNTRTQVQLLGRFDQQPHTYVIGKNTLFQDSRGTGIRREDLKIDTSYILLSTQVSGTSSATLIRSLAQ